ncbi:MAG TPA: hypothetical protein VFC07_14115 [Verrucomicrobiae bacterium]|nr:hypothetical protein [Verrucomicrobiae bacterium]
MGKVPPAVWCGLIFVFVVITSKSGAFYNHHSSERAEIANAIGSIGFFYGLPQVDQSGSRIFYLRTSEQGLGLYSQDIAPGKSTLLREWLTSEGKSLNGQSLLSISPDNTLIPVILSAEASKNSFEICDAGTGAAISTIKANGGTIAGGTWLAANKLAWLRQAPDTKGKRTTFRIHLAQGNHNGKWSDKEVSPALTNAPQIFTLAEDKVGWKDQDGVYALTIGQDQPVMLFQSPGGQITYVDYCQQKKKFLVTCHDKGQFYLWAFEPAPNGSLVKTQIKKSKMMESAQWINDGDGFAYLDAHVLVVKANTASVVPLEGTGVESMVAPPHGGGIYFIGMTGQEPGLGLWRCDATNLALTSVVCYSDAPSPKASRIEPIHCTLSSPKHAVKYYVYRPKNFDSHRKYPMLIGNTIFGRLAYQRDFDGPSWAEAMANCGAYIVIVERNDWFLNNANEWGEKLLAVYDHLKGDSTVDTSRVYLYGASIETTYMAKFLEHKPKPWRGLILFNPGILPKATFGPGQMHFQKVLISAGKEEYHAERFINYQQEMCASGVMVQICEHPNAAHVLTSIPATRDRILAMEEFIFEE